MKARITFAAVGIAALLVAAAFADKGQAGRTTQQVAAKAAATSVNEHAGHGAEPAAGQTAPAPSMKNMPPDEEGAKQRLNTSPRHGELVKVMANGMPVTTWVVYPERKTKAPVVVVIQEIFGLTDWIRAVADQLAADGFIAIAPDLLSGHGPKGGGTEAFASRDDATKAVRDLSQDEIMARLDAVREYGLKLPAANGKSASIGLCFGGSTSFAYAVHQPALAAAVVYYGSAPSAPGTPQGSFVPAPSLANTKAPVLAFYGGSDARINATVPATEAKMKELGKSYQPNTFEGAGHGFLRAQTGQDGANMKATMQAWPKTIGFLRQYTEGNAASKSR